MKWRKLRGRAGLQCLNHEMNGVIEYDAMDPWVVHDACMEIDEYAQATNLDLYKDHESVN